MTKTLCDRCGFQCQPTIVDRLISPSIDFSENIEIALVNVGVTIPGDHRRPDLCVGCFAEVLDITRSALLVQTGIDPEQARRRDYQDASRDTTPGPWRVGRNYGAVVADVRHPGAWSDDRSRHDYGGSLICESVRSEANARLIAAAPALLSALDDAYAFLHARLAPCQADCACPLHSVKAVLDAAKGGAA